MKYRILFVVFALFAFAACNPAAPEATSEQPQAPSQQELEEPVKETVEEVVEKSVPEEESVQDVAEESGDASLLESFFKKKMKLEYEVDYDMTSTMNGQKTEDKMTQYIKSPEKMRFDTSTADGEFRTYIIADVLTSCNQASGDWSCVEIPSQPTESDVVQDKLEESPADFSVRKLPDRTIAGTQATCFAVDVEESTVEDCFSPEGVPLYVHTEGTEAGVSFATTLIATSYQTRVSDLVFDLPAEASAIPVPGGNPEDYAALIEQYT